MYKALYRKYRPKTFDEIIGQEHITKVLENQIKTNSISHAYLFSGTRGTGKTSCAKIFARAVNCLSEDKKPCNKCENCMESLDESSIDIIEIDAASNNSVDNIRDLKDRAFYQPTSLKYKVYIIDEIHMLSNSAFNALLKILEEPPEHLIFILATTEPEKIPLTILSRCQKFQFRRINPIEIEKSLRSIAKNEGITLDDRTYNLIVNSSDGSMRDAQSIMEQLVSSGREEIDYDFATQILGVVSRDLLFKISQAIIDNDHSSMLEILDESIALGKDIEQLGKDILNHLRNLMIAKVSKESLEKIVFSNRKEYLDQAKELDLKNILDSMEKLIKQLGEIKYSQQKRVLLEIALLEIMSINNPVNTEKVVEKVVEAKPNRDRKLRPAKKLEKSKPQNKVSKKEINKTKVNDEISKNNSNISKDELTLSRIESDWNDILFEIKNSPKKLIHALVIEASVEDYKDGVLTLGYYKEYEFHRNNLMKDSNREFLENLISMFYNREVKIDTVFIDDLEEKSIDNDIETLTNLVGEDNINVY